jgi:hypothetical protein
VIQLAYGSGVSVSGSPTGRAALGELLARCGPGTSIGWSG